MKIQLKTAAFGDGGSAIDEPHRRRGLWGVVTLMIVALLLVATFIYVLPGLPSTLSKLWQRLFQSTNPNDNFTQSLKVYSPVIQNGSADIPYPSGFSALASFAVNLINQDRANFSLAPVALSSGRSGQQHADSMLKYGYFSHYDTQGYKPYMRYTLLGGIAGDTENVAFYSYSLPHFLTQSDVEVSLKVLESSMMYNDSACCNNGHRDNILNPLHNRVAIGIAYDSTTLYFDEEFENYYINMTFTAKSNVITMQGNVLSLGLNPNQIFVGYDNTPAPETIPQLNRDPREYDVGTAAGGVLPPCNFPCPTLSEGVTVYATTWDFTSSSMTISFSLSDFVKEFGSGVYTIYLLTGSDTSKAITSISVFVR